MSRSWKQFSQGTYQRRHANDSDGKAVLAASQGRKIEIKKLFQRENVRRLVTSLRSRDDKATIKMLDAAYWMKGCSPLGRLRFAVLLGIGEPPYKGEVFA
jgi:uncharacterized protein (DUF2252 family)